MARFPRETVVVGFDQSRIARREVLAAGAALGGLLPVKATAAAHDHDSAKQQKRRERSVIVLLQEGGMSHFESWDPKPAAPSEVRGSFETIQTSNPELHIGEHMPLLAQQAHVFNVIRSVYMDNARRDHSPGLHWVLTGYDNQSAGVSLEKHNRYPAVGSVVAHQRNGATAIGLPCFVTIPNSRQLGNRVRYTGAMHLGANHEPFDSGSVPDRSDVQYTTPAGLSLPSDVSGRRLQNRRVLLESTGLLQRTHRESTRHTGLAGFQATAFDLLMGDRGKRAFDLNLESAKTRAAYGNSQMGQGTLLARRLVEHGVSYVLVNYSKNNSWDTHGDNFNKLKNTLLPPMDRAASALLADLDERGMLDDVLVVLMGEMGRTPKINKKSGRDHWPDVFSVMIAGGGLTRGHVLGSSTRLGETPAERPVHYHEILATIYHQLGIDPHLMINDGQGRPIRIMPEADVIRELCV